VRAYADQLPRLRADRQLLAIEAAAAPYMQKSDRAKLLSRYQRLARLAGEPKRSLAGELALIAMPRIEVPKEVK
jgi:hypothetical protein